MRKLLLNGNGILGINHAAGQRKALELDRHDFSVDPITIIFSRNVEGVSKAFCYQFMRVSAYRTYDGVIPLSGVYPQKLHRDFGIDYSPLCLGPYRFECDGEITSQFGLIRHKLHGAVAGLYNYWRLDQREPGRDSLSEALEYLPR